MKRIVALVCILGACAAPAAAAVPSRHDFILGATPWQGSGGDFAAAPGTILEQASGGDLTAAINSLGPVYSATGRVRLSVDALGTASASGLIQVEKPAGATVRAAFLVAASFGNFPIPNGGIIVNGAGVTWSQSVPGVPPFYLRSFLANVTGIVAPVVNAAAPGIVNLTVREGNSSMVDGSVLAVVFDDPSLTSDRTVVIFFGALDSPGQDFRLSLDDPARPADPDYLLDFSLGISNSYQGAGGTGQASMIDVNGQRMTSSAGGEDDGAAATGALVTAGGVGDSDTNPADPNAAPTGLRYDDELYDLRPFVQPGDHLIRLHIVNPTNDDNLFFGALAASGRVGLGDLTLSPAFAHHLVGATHVITGTLLDVHGQPVAGTTIDFRVTNGPQAGLTGSAVTDQNGQASFSYVGGAAGTDSIRASFSDRDGQRRSSIDTAVTEWQPVTYTLDVSVTGGGRVTKDPDLPAYPAGSRVQLTAIANPGSRFEGWSGDASGPANPATIVVDSNKQITAIFALANLSPDCSGARASVEELWPPNHKLVPVGISGVLDPEGDPVTITVTGVTQDEPLSAEGDGNTCPDAVIGQGRAWVRAERSGGGPKGPGNGRVYTIAFTATDGRGGSCEGAVEVCVPHDGRPGRRCVKDALVVNSLGSCEGGRALSGDGGSAGLELRAAAMTNGVARLEYSLPEDGEVQVGVYDITGRRVATLEDSRQMAGLHQASWNGRGLPGGMYFCRLQSRGVTVARPVLVIQ